MVSARQNKDILQIENLFILDTNMRLNWCMCVCANTIDVEKCKSNTREKEVQQHEKNVSQPVHFDLITFLLHSVLYLI